MRKSIFVWTAMVAFVLAACNEPAYINGPGDNSHNLDSIPVLVPDTNGIQISIDSAITICKSGAAGAELYKLTGVVSKNTTNPMSVPGSYTNINFDLNDGTGTIACYYTNNLNNRPFRKNSDVPRVGSKLTVLGTLEYYNNTTPELKNGFIVRIDSMVAPPPFPGCPEPDSTEISVSQAVAIASGLSDGQKTDDTYNILGVVTEVLEFSASNGNATYIISDGKAFFEVYRGKGYKNANLTNANQVQPNDTLTVNAKITNYKGTYETSGNAPIVKSTNPNL